MDKLIDKVKENILNKKLINDKDIIILGVSGGPDSVFLLYSLVKLKDELKKYNITYSIVIAHINHGIRKEAINDENLVKMYSEKYNLPIYIEHKDVKLLSKKLKISEEECGRNIRYEFFDKVKDKVKGNKIAVAHNMNDNAETILFNLFRGSGMAGLSGMEYISNNEIIRPLLNIDKKEIIQFLKDNNIKYAIDKTNKKNIYTRNKIRNDLIKKIEKEYNPNIISVLNKTAEILTIDKEIISNHVNEIFNEIVLTRQDKCVTIDVNKLNKQDLGTKAYIIRKIIEEILGNIKDLEYIHVQDIIKLIDNNIPYKKFIIGKKFEVEIEKNNKAIFSKR